MRFLVENVAKSNLKMVTEEVGGAEKLYIKGIFAQAELKNRNNRVYPKAVMDKAIDRFKSTYVDTKRAIGELSHPDRRPMPKPEFASHLVTELTTQGNNVYGKALILETPQGNIVRGLLKGGVQLGVSTRGLGSVEPANGVTVVQDDYMITAIDIVTDPSAIDAWVSAVNESAEWLVTDDGRIVESLQKQIRKDKLTEETKLIMLRKFFGMLRLPAGIR